MNLANFTLEQDQDSQSEDSQSDLNMASQNENNDTVCSRKGEDIMQVRFRANRLFAIGMDWYFSTREGTDQGPFNSKENAEEAITKFISEIQI